MEYIAAATCVIIKSVLLKQQGRARFMNLFLPRAGKKGAEGPKVASFQIHPIFALLLLAF